MCGILVVKHKYTIPTQKLVETLDLLHTRGKDLSVYSHKNNIFLGQSVLNFTGSLQFYHTLIERGFAFNGEIYDYSQKFKNDSDQVFELVQKQQWNELHNLVGPKSWIFNNAGDIYYGTDWQHEKVLWHYQDEEIFILSSTITAILNLVNVDKQSFCTDTKHINWLNKTFYKNINRVKPGVVYKNGCKLYSKTIYDIKNTITTFSGTFTEAVDELDFLLEKSCKRIATHDLTLFYSGGIDSGLIGAYIPQAHFIGLDIADRDSISHNSGADQKITCTLEQWSEHFKKICKQLSIPPLSWSWVGYSILCSVTQNKIVVSGTGADELFAGYPYHLESIESPYSKSFPTDWFCTDDYVHQSGGTDLLGMDQVSGMYNMESRSPFADSDIIKFAMSLPYEFVVQKQIKTIFRKLWEKKFMKPYPYPKIGFVGYCNDAIPIINKNYKQNLTNRNQEWKNFVIWNFNDYNS